MKMAYAATLAAFFISLALLLAITPLLRRLKAGQYILGYVKEHKNKSGTPTMGGLAFVCAATIVSLCFCGVNSTTVNLTLVITAGYCLIGFADDFLKIYRKENLGLRPYQKIIFQCAIAAIAAAYCYVNKLTLLNIPFTHITVDISWGIIPLAVFVFLSAVNCVNLTDGLDGLAGGTSLASRGVRRNAHRLGFRPRHGKSCNVRRAGSFFAVQHQQGLRVYGRYGFACPRRADKLRFRLFAERAVYTRNRHNVRNFGNICNYSGNIL